MAEVKQSDEGCNPTEADDDSEYNETPDYDEGKQTVNAFDGDMHISVAGNQDGRLTAIGYFISVHGSNGKDKRDDRSFYVIGHQNDKKKGIFKFHPFKSNNKDNLFKIQLV